MKRKLLAMLGMALVSAGAAAYMSIMELKDKTKSVLMDNKNDAVEEVTQAKETEKKMVPSVCGALHVDGKYLVDKNGKPVQLKGISTHDIAWYPQYINADCFKELHEKWKMNVVRLAMYTAEQGGYCTDGDKEELKQLIRDGVRLAAENDMYALVDWHILSDYNPNMNKAEAIAFFDEICADLAGYENVLYEICNEPNQATTTWAEICAYAEEVIPVIRKHTNAVIIVGTPSWSQRVDHAAAAPIKCDDNVMYTLHFYAGTHKEKLRSNMISAIIAGLPIFVTEYGICNADGNGALDYESVQAWVDTMNAYNISYTMWNLGSKDESSCIIKKDCEKVSGFTAEDLNDSGKWLYHMLTGTEIQ